jgi:hypothetical protein
MAEVGDSSSLGRTILLVLSSQQYHRLPLDNSPYTNYNSLASLRDNIKSLWIKKASNLLAFLILTTYHLG